MVSEGDIGGCINNTGKGRCVMRKAFIVVSLAALLAGCANRQPGYDRAYMECEVMAAQITGPNGNILTQSYYISNCMRQKGFQP